MNSIKQATDMEGFGLEEKTLKIFKDGGFDVWNNFPLANNLSVDIFAYSESNPIFIIECKGSLPDHCLTLWDESKRLIDEKPNTHQALKKDSRLLCHRFLEVLVSESNKGMHYYFPSIVNENQVILCAEEIWPPFFTFRYCHTGDFRSGTAPHKQLPKQDNKNNLYKGVKQLLARIANLQTKITEIVSESSATRKRVIPVVVTKARIYVVVDQEQPAEVGWAIYDCERITSLEDNPLSVKYVFIVNIEQLSTFIERVR